MEAERRQAVMKSERWEQVEALYHSALGRQPGERDAFLAEACQGDDELRREVESLLAQDASGSHLLDNPAWEGAGSLLRAPSDGTPGEANPSAPSNSRPGDRPRGQIVSHYTILEKLGSGGMGVVYRASDLRLDRTVALKFLSPEISTEEEYKKRFLREAKAASALDHPNICTIHEIDVAADGQMFIAMAYYPGETLKKKIQRGPLPVPEAVDLAMQVARGLAKAHQQGIAHRDIKPANVLVTEEGVVKIVDFGLAQLDDATKLTKSDSTLGTPAYMSPEQAQRMPGDHRSDIWSLGVLLYEMVAGRVPFEGRHEAVLLAIIHEQHQPITAVRAGVPLELDRIVGMALAKKPGERYQHVDEVLEDLRNLKKEQEPTSTRSPEMHAPRSRSRVLWYVGAGLSLLAVLVGAFLSLRFLTSSPPATLRAVPLTSYVGDERDPTFSPDGNQVAFSWNSENQDNYDIYVQVVGSATPLRLTTDPAVDGRPAWSPDGRQIAFLRSSPAHQAIYLIPPLGGAERKVAEIAPFVVRPFSPPGLAWAPDGKSLLFSEAGPAGEPPSIYELALETGQRERLTSPPVSLSFGDAEPAVSPDGKTLAFMRGPNAWSEVYLLPLGGGEPRRLTSHGNFSVTPAWTANSAAIIYASAPYLGRTTLWRISVSGGEARQLASLGQDVQNPSIAGGRLAYEQVSGDTNIWRFSLPAAGVTGPPPQQVIASTHRDSTPRISPDGTRIAFGSSRTGAMQIWMCNQDGSRLVQLTSMPAEAGVGSPRWSPDGRRIVFDVIRGGNREILMLNFEGGSPQPVAPHQADDSRPSWSNDGRWIYFASSRSESFQIWKVPVEGGDPIQVTKGGGYQPFESPDGRFLFFGRRNGPGVWRIPVDGGEEVVVLPDLPAAGTSGCWDVTAEGIYFLEPRRSETAESKWSLRLLRFDTGGITDVMEVGVGRLGGLFGNVVFGASPLSISPDGKWFLLARNDQLGRDLMLVEDLE